MKSMHEMSGFIEFIFLDKAKLPPSLQNYFNEERTVLPKCAFTQKNHW